jgi:hypothetical protein
MLMCFISDSDYTVQALVMFKFTLTLEFTVKQFIFTEWPVLTCNIPRFEIFTPCNIPKPLFHNNCAESKGKCVYPSQLQMQIVHMGSFFH